MAFIDQNLYQVCPINRLAQEVCLSVNYNTLDTNLANAGTVKTVTGSGPDISVASNFSSAHTVIDVLGYYYPAP